MKLAKQKLRKSVREILANFPTSQVATESLAINKRLKNHEFYQRAECVCFYMPMAKEVDLTEILTLSLGIMPHLIIDSKKCYIPVMLNGEIEMLKINGHEDLKSFVQNSWGILEPPLDTMDQRINLLNEKVEFCCVICPGLAFDAKLNRLGKGKGYYDRFLSRLKQKCEFKTLAVSLSCQMTDFVPTEDRDIKMDHIILPDQEI